MKRLRYSPAFPRPPSKRVLQHRLHETSTKAITLAAQNVRLTDKLQYAESEAQSAKSKLRQMFRVSARCVEFDSRVVDVVVRVDVDLPYRDPSALLAEVAIGCITKLVEAAPQLSVGLEQNLLKQIRSTPTKERDYAIYTFVQRLRYDTPPPPELQNAFERINTHEFLHLLKFAAENDHLLDGNPNRHTPWSSKG